VGTSGGGYLTAGYAYGNPEQVAGMVFVDVEKRDFLQVETDAWNGRRGIGDIPVTVITDDPSAATIRQASSASATPWRRQTRSS
jgi:pimeloyl-ACP methyl ester carboxylesterase